MTTHKADKSRCCFECAKEEVDRLRGKLMSEFREGLVIEPEHPEAPRYSFEGSTASNGVYSLSPYDVRLAAGGRDVAQIHPDGSCDSVPDLAPEDIVTVFGPLLEYAAKLLKRVVELEASIPTLINNVVEEEVFHAARAVSKQWESACTYDTKEIVALRDALKKLDGLRKMEDVNG